MNTGRRYNISSTLMESSRFELFLSCFLFLMITRALSQPPFEYKYCFDDRGNYTDNSTYRTNLYFALSNLTNTISDPGYKGFLSVSYGENAADNVYATGICRGDVAPDDCSTCLGFAYVASAKLCPYNKEAIIAYDNCKLHYSDISMDGILEIDSSEFSYMGQNISSVDVDGYNQRLMALLERLRSEAAAGGPLVKFASGNATVSFNETVYAVVQCTPDLSEKNCSDCLDVGLGFLPLTGNDNGRYVNAYCDLRYEPFLFYAMQTQVLPPSPAPYAEPVSPPPSTSGKRSNKSRTLIIIFVPIVVVSVLLILFCMYLSMTRNKKKLQDEDEIRRAEAIQFDFGAIRVATNNFSEANKIGRGGFGVVYMGRLSTEEDVAVKRLSMDSAQGDIEFKNEVLLMAKLQHRNLVSLLGFCLEGHERLLVYEFLPNGSLDQFIFDPIKRTQMNWGIRYKIIIGICRGLLYLHEDSRLKIIHRDLKASNILLDTEMTPKIADFGMAKLFLLDQTRAETNRIVGTYGYMAPEYVLRGQVSVKSDVYSFGVLLLEIVSGQKNSSFHNGENDEGLISCAWKTWREGTASNFIDPTLGMVSTSEIMRCIHIGLLCVQQTIADRPTMTSVIQMLISPSLTVPVPSEPTFFQVENEIIPATVVRSNAHSVNEPSITDLTPRG